MFSTKPRVFGALIVGALALATCGSESEPPITVSADVTSEGAPAAEPTAEQAGENTVEDLKEDRVTETPATESEDENTDEDSEAGHVHGEDDDHGSATGLAGDADPADAVVTLEVVVVNGSVIGGAQRHEVDTGAVVLIEVTLGEADEVHLHGYDFVVEGESGETVQIAFVAEIPGVWELELEGQGLELLELEVS